MAISTPQEITCGWQEERKNELLEHGVPRVQSISGALKMLSSPKEGKPKPMPMEKSPLGDLRVSMGH
jgi:hypothetical protein